MIGFIEYIMNFFSFLGKNIDDRTVQQWLSEESVLSSKEIYVSKLFVHLFSTTTILFMGVWNCFDKNQVIFSVPLENLSR